MHIITLGVRSKVKRKMISFPAGLCYTGKGSPGAVQKLLQGS